MDFSARECDMEKHMYKTIPLLKALVLRNEERMGMTFHNIRADISGQLRQGIEEGFQISSGRVYEDYRDFNEVLLIFQAEPINGLTGQYILALSVQNINSITPGILIIRKAWMVQSGDQFSIHMEIKANATINERWAYTRHPNTRQVDVALFDDPYTVIEGRIFHQTSFPFQPSTYHQVMIEAGWTTVGFILVPQLIDQSKLIDLCEMLLEAFDKKFSAFTGQYLQWSMSLTTHEGIDVVTSEVENRLLQEGDVLSFNVTVELADQEINRNKRIRPLIKHSLTLIQEDGTHQAGTIGISISTQ
jgi:hypothetical protein